MSNGPDATYQENLQREHANLLAEYTAKPFGDRHRRADLEAALDHVEQKMLDKPPYHRNDEGVWVPRKTGLIQDDSPDKVKAVSLAEAGIKVIPKSDWGDIISDPNRTPPKGYVKHIFDQDGVGSCASEGICGCVAARRSADGQEHVRLNPWFVYHTVSGGRDSGSSLQSNLAFMQKYGCASHDVWPRSKGWRARPSDEAYEDALQYRVLEYVRVTNEEELGTMVLSGFPVYFGYPGHAIWMAEILSATSGVLCNSWSPDWSDGGFGSIRFSRIQWSYWAYAILSVIDRRAA